MECSPAILPISPAACALFRIRRQPYPGIRVKRAVAFVDGQNLFRHAKEAFGHHHPNHDPNMLFDAVCRENGWQNRGVRYYTGVPKADKDPFWHGYWTKRLRAIDRRRSP